MQTLIVQPKNREAIVNEAVKTLQAGGLVIFPTETTYGAGVDATNPEAVQKLLSYKARREGKPLSIAVTDTAMAEQFVELNDSARRLYERFLPGPVTVVSKSLGTVAPGVPSEFGTLGVRIPDYQLVLDMVKALGKPITATSANGSGEKRPYSVKEIFDGLSEKQKSLIDLVIDAGTLPPNPPSTVIDTTLSTPVTLRSGEITLHDESATTITSHNEQETKELAGKLVLKNWDRLKETGLVIGLDGALGTGKTIFTKGVAEFLQITDIITSPTYTYIEEYDFLRHNVSGKLYHLDLWKVETAEEFERLAVASLLQPKSVIVIEWFKQVKDWVLPLIESQPLPLLRVTFTQKADQREITFTEAT